MRDNIIPIMDSNSNDFCTVSASSKWASEPYNAVDGTSTFFRGNSSTGWWKIDFSTPQIIGKYSGYFGQSGSEYAIDWNFECSNDNSTWTILHQVRKNSSYNLIENVFDNTKAYKYYRFNFLVSQYDFRINNIKMNAVLLPDYLIKQNENYFSIKPEYYKNIGYTPLKLYGGLNPIKDDFNSFGFNNLKDMTTTVSSRIINGADKGVLGDGKYFELELSNDCVTITNQPENIDVDATIEISDKSFLQYYANPQTVTISIPENYYSKFGYTLYENGGYTAIFNVIYYYTDGTTQKIQRSVKDRDTVMKYDTIDRTKKCNKIEVEMITTASRFLDVKLFKSLNILYLFSYNSQLYTFNGQEIILSPSQNLDENNFINNGISNLLSITQEQLSEAFPMKVNLKLLAWTYDTTKTNVDILCDVIPYKPIDKFNKLKLLMII